MRKDLFSNIKVSQVEIAAVKTATATSDSIDVAGFESLAVVFDVGNSGDVLSGSVYWTLSLTECDTTDGSFTAVSADDVKVQGGTFGTTSTYVIDAPSEDSRTVKFGYVGSKRFVQAVATATGSHSSGTPIGIIAIQGNPSVAPQNDA